MIVPLHRSINLRNIPSVELYSMSKKQGLFVFCKDFSYTVIPLQIVLNGIIASNFLM